MKRRCKKDTKFFTIGVFVGGVLCGFVGQLRCSEKPKLAAKKTPAPIGKEFKAFLQQIKEEDSSIIFEISSDKEN